MDPQSKKVFSGSLALLAVILIILLPALSFAGHGPPRKIVSRQMVRRGRRQDRGGAG